MQVLDNKNKENDEELPDPVDLIEFIELDEDLPLSSKADLRDFIE